MKTVKIITFKNELRYENIRLQGLRLSPTQTGLYRATEDWCRLEIPDLERRGIALSM